MVIQAGQFNQRSTLSERKELLQDILREKLKKKSYDLPTPEQLNRMLARGVRCVLIREWV